MRQVLLNFDSINCDSPALWQTYLQEPASISMEGILTFNKHLLFLLTVIVVFVAWLLFYTLYYFAEFNNNRSKTKSFVFHKNSWTIQRMLPRTKG